MLLIDDFGRQDVSPQQLFNRWILARPDGSITSASTTASRFRSPSSFFLVFATNLAPAHIADDAFLRRVPNKINVEPPDAGAFDSILRRVLRHRALPYNPEFASALRDVCHQRASGELRACFPHDLVEIIFSRAAYRRTDCVLTGEALLDAADTYFSQA